jgi:sec-independent protein translocase protein TatA
VARGGTARGCAFYIKKHSFKEINMLPSGWEWIIILIIVVLVFGVGRISKISGEIGSSIRAFREGVTGPKDDKEKEKKKEEEEKKES